MNCHVTRSHQNMAHNGNDTGSTATNASVTKKRMTKQHSKCNTALERAKRIGLKSINVNPKLHWEAYHNQFVFCDLFCFNCDVEFNYIDPNIVFLPERCPGCNGADIGPPHFCKVHCCVWSESLGECPLCEEEQYIRNNYK